MKEAAQELFVNVENDRYAPKLEPEQPAESGIRRDEVITKPEAMRQEEELKEEEPKGDTLDFSAMFEAQADVFAAADAPAEKVEEPIMAIPAASAEPAEDDFDLSKLL